ncbi:MAG: hydroxyethylthiazole kinase [Deferrisomatales bacterium]|nr:hydroxyethylthiazole kinase [Deferrisomatales bacterium]
MTQPDVGRGAAERLERVRGQRPLVHNITNYVVMNVTANALLACGAAPVMAHAREEVEEMVAAAGALVLNIGTLSPPWVDAMAQAGRAANHRGIPVVLDPVGSGVTRLRTEAARRLTREVKISVLRGNASEVLSLVRPGAGGKGVEAVHGVEKAAEDAVRLARELGAAVAVTGAVDFVTDGHRACRVHNGHPLLARVTGTGCTATALIGAFLAVPGDPWEAAAGALAYLGSAGELAARGAAGPGTFQVNLLDSLAAIDGPRLAEMARIEVVGGEWKV